MHCKNILIQVCVYIYIFSFHKFKSQVPANHSYNYYQRYLNCSKSVGSSLKVRSLKLWSKWDIYIYDIKTETWTSDYTKIKQSNIWPILEINSLLQHHCGYVCTIYIFVCFPPSERQVFLATWKDIPNENELQYQIKECHLNAGMQTCINKKALRCKAIFL